MSTVYHTQSEASTNVDFDEVKKFDAMANYWWDLHGPCQPLHLLNPIRLTFIHTHCTLMNKRVIDVGCGGGILTEQLSRTAAHVVGIDQSEAAIAVATQHAACLPHPPAYHLATVEDYAATHSEAFDVLTCLELLEHVPDPLSTIRACAQLVKPGGDLFFSTLNRTSHAFWLAIVGAEYVFNLLPRGTHRYDRFIRPSELTQWLQEADVHSRHIQGLTYAPIAKNFRLTRDVRVNYILHCQRSV